MKLISFKNGRKFSTEEERIYREDRANGEYNKKLVWGRKRIVGYGGDKTGADPGVPVRRLPMRGWFVSFVD